MQLSDEDRLNEPWSQLQSALGELGARVVVEGPTGSGRSVLLGRLRAHASLVAVEPPPLGDADAVFHALVQLAAPLDEEVRGAAQDSSRPLRDRVSEVVAALSASSVVVAVRVPVSWKLGVGSERILAPDTARWRERARDLIEILTAPSDLRLVLLVASAADLPSRPGGGTNIRLRPMRIRPEALEDLSAFGAYAPAAEFVAARCRALRVLPTPIQFRVAVGLRGLGALRESDVELLEQSGSNLTVLEQRLVRALANQRELARAVCRVALARQTLPRESVASLSRIPAEHSPLVTECLAYGTTEVRMHERIRRAVLTSRHGGMPSVKERVDAHYALAQHHRALDGAPALSKAPNAVHWLERVHHLAGSGEKGAEEWEDLELHAPEHYWDRARALSLAGDYAGAAKVYATCIERFGAEDSYAQHYLGFNIDLAGGDPKSAEDALRAAVRLDPDNPWWNTRLVTFLIEHARYLAARHEWCAALERVDPSGDRVSSDEWLARHFHYWVVEAWLDEGQVELARDTFDAIPWEIAAASPNLRRLEERLLDAEEARMLGESVYPASVPAAERWLAPQSRLPATSSAGAPRRAWYPGRVIEGNDEEGVMIVFVTPSSEPAARRVKVRELATDEWRAAAKFRPEGFFELATYEDDEIVILPVDDRMPDWSRPVDVRRSTRHFREPERSRH